MKSILSLIILVLVTVIQAMPRYVLIPIEDVAFMQVSKESGFTQGFEPGTFRLTIRHSANELPMEA